MAIHVCFVAVRSSVQEDEKVMPNLTSDLLSGVVECKLEFEVRVVQIILLRSFIRGVVGAGQQICKLISACFYWSLATRAAVVIVNPAVTRNQIVPIP